MIRNLIERGFSEGKKYLEAAGLSTDAKPTAGLVTGSRFIEVDTGDVYAFDEAGGAWRKVIAGGSQTPGGDDLTRRVTSLTALDLAPGSVIEAVGLPAYLDAADLDDYAAYGLTDTGWYAFARIAAPEGVTVTAETTVAGAAGAIVTSGADHVDVAVRFGVTAASQQVTVSWGETSETFVFKANDLAIRNLDYRATFYLYDLTQYVTWSYALTTDTTFVADKNYYTEADGVYTLAEVQTTAYALTADTTFQEGKTYYTKDGDTYTAATVTVGDPVTPETYYEQSTVPVPAYYVQTGEETYERATGTFADGVTYYTYDGTTYTAAEVTTGAAIPAYYTHSKATIAGMSRNVTYKLDAMIDCPIEIVLPEVAGADYGAWYELQLRYNGSYSCTLLPPTGVKVGTVTTQAQTAGINVIDLQYTSVGGVQMWSLLNTHSNIPT